MNYRQLLIAISLFWFLNACRHPESFQYREIKDLQVKHIGLTTSVVALKLVFYNPNNFSVNLKNVDCAVFFNQKYLITYKLDTMMHISGKSTFEIPANINFDMVDIIKRGISTFLNKEALITLKGTARVGKAIFYKDIPLQYEMKYKLPL